jgi:hypothetical protein
MKTIDLETAPLTERVIFEQALMEPLRIKLPNHRQLILMEVDEGDAEAAQMAATPRLMELLNQPTTKRHSLADVKAHFGL